MKRATCKRPTQHALLRDDDPEEGRNFAGLANSARQAHDRARGQVDPSRGVFGFLAVFSPSESQGGKSAGRSGFPLWDSVGLAGIPGLFQDRW